MSEDPRTGCSQQEEDPADQQESSRAHERKQLDIYVSSRSGNRFACVTTCNPGCWQTDRKRHTGEHQIGATSEVVEVTAVPSALQTDSTTVGNTITETTLLDAPLNGRNVYGLIQLQAGVTSGSSAPLASGNNATDRRLPSGIAANGQQEIYNNNLVDGLDNNERATGIVILRPSVEAIAEVRTDVNLYNAEVGRTGGAVINVITKSGANAIHGSAHEFFRNDITDSRNFFIAPTLHKPELRQNQFGGSLSGPIKKDKTFFFVDYEGFRRIDATNNVYYSIVPTLAEEQTPGYFGDIVNPFTRTPVATIPTASIDPTSLAYFKTYPALMWPARRLERPTSSTIPAPLSFRILATYGSIITSAPTTPCLRVTPTTAPTHSPRLSSQA